MDCLWHCFTTFYSHCIKNPPELYQNQLSVRRNCVRICFATRIRARDSLHLGSFHDFFLGGVQKDLDQWFWDPRTSWNGGSSLVDLFFSVTVGAWRLLSSSAPQARRQGKQTIQEFVAFGFWRSIGNNYWENTCFHLDPTSNTGFPSPASRSIPEIAKAKVRITRKTTPKHKRIWCRGAHGDDMRWL